jgi:hypothetical protein
MNLG